MPKWKPKAGLWLSIGVFVFLVVWYRNVHPYVVFSFDDWRFTAQTRSAVPWPYAWNPTRLLPELLMPAFGYVAAFLFYPLTGDYIGALTDVTALAASLFVTAYVYMFYRYLRRKFAVGGGMAATLATLFLGLHFLVMRARPSGNQYLLGGEQPNLLYFYIIPALVNAMLILYFESPANPDDPWSARRPARGAALVVACYFAVCSNMYCSVLLAVYAFVRLLSAYARQAPRRSAVRAVAQNRGFAALLAGWLVSIVIEFFGGRSRKVRGVARNRALYASLRHYLKSLIGMNPLVLALAIVLLAACVALLWRRKKKRDGHDAAMLGSLSVAIPGFLLVSVYSVLLAAIVSPSDMTDAKLWVVMLFYLFFGLCAGVAYLAQRCPRLAMAIPLGVIVLLSFTVASGQRMFTDGTPNDMDAAVCRALDEYVIECVTEADRAGLDAVTVEVPQTGQTLNVPMNVEASEYLAQALYRHRITSRLMAVTYHPNEEINARFQLNAALKRA